MAQPSAIWPNGAAQESNLPSLGLPGLTGFEGFSTLAQLCDLHAVRATPRASHAATIAACGAGRRTRRVARCRRPQQLHRPAHASELRLDHNDGFLGKVTATRARLRGWRASQSTAPTSARSGKAISGGPAQRCRLAPPSPDGLQGERCCADEDAVQRILLLPMNEHVMAALLYAAAFFEGSTEDECDVDLAVKQLEGIAYHLRQLSATEQKEFRRFAYRLADSDPNPHVAAELRRVADGLLPLDDD
jgi:hypothetical protein